METGSVYKMREILTIRRVSGRWSPKCGSLPRDAGDLVGLLADCQLTDWTSRRLVNLRSSQLADWTTRGLADSAKRTKAKHAKSPVASSSCPVRDLSSPQVGNLRVVQSPICIAHYGVCRHRPSGTATHRPCWPHRPYTVYMAVL